MIYVTHDQVEAMTMADKIVVLQAGSVEQVGSPLDLYHHPRNLFVAGFIGSPRMNLLPAQVVQSNADGTVVALASGERIVVGARASAARQGDAVTLGIRPEALRLDPAGTIAATVRLVERLGGLTLLHVAGGGRPGDHGADRGQRPDRAHEQIRLAVDPRGLPPVRQERPGAARPTGIRCRGCLTAPCNSMFLGSTSAPPPSRRCWWMAPARGRQATAPLGIVPPRRP